MIWFWFKRKNNKYRWICLECSKPVWWKPHFDKYSFGIRLGWLLFALGTGLVTKEQMESLENELKVKDGDSVGTSRR